MFIYLDVYALYLKSKGQIKNWSQHLAELISPVRRGHELDAAELISK